MHLSRRVARAQFGRPVVGRLIGPRGTPGALSAAACASDGEVARRGRRERRVRPHALRGRLAAGESGGARRAVAMCAARARAGRGRRCAAWCGGWGWVRVATAGAGGGREALSPKPVYACAGGREGQRQRAIEK